MPDLEGQRQITVLLAVVGPMLMLYLQHLSRQPASVAPSTGNIILDLHPVNYILAWISFIGGVGLGFLIFEFPIRTITDFCLAFAMPTLFVSAAIGMFVALRHRIELSDSGIESGYGGRGKRSIDWDDVSRVTFSPFYGCFTVTARGGEVIHVSLQMRGIPEFVRTLKCRLPPELLAEARTALDVHDR